MGNNISYEQGDDDELVLSGDGLGFSVSEFTVDAMDSPVRSQNYHPSNLPVIREKPNLDKFQVSRKLDVKH